MSYSEAFLHIQADFSSYVDEARPVSRMEAGETLAIGVAWTDGDEVLDITGAEVSAIAASASGQEVTLSAGIDDGPLGRTIITDPPGTLSQGFWVIRLLLTLAGRSRRTSCRLQVLAAPQLQPGQPLPVAPRVIGSIDPVSVDEGTPVAPIELTTVFDLGSPTAGLALQEPVAGLSIVGTELRFDTSVAIATAAFTVVATNSVDSVTVSSSFEVTASITPVGPLVIGSIGAVSVEEGTPVAPVELTTVFDLGTPTANLALQAPVAGLSIVGTELRFDTSVVRASAAFTVVATNTVDSVSVPSSFEVTAAGATVQENPVNFAADTGVNMVANGLPTTAPAFTIAFKVRRKPAASLGFLVGTLLDTFVRMDNLGRTDFRVEATDGNPAIDQGNVLTPAPAPDDFLNVIIAADGTQAKMVVAHKVGTDSFGPPVLVASAVYDIAVDLKLPQWINTRNPAIANSMPFDWYGIWAVAGVYMDPEALFSAFFQADGTLTPAFFSGPTINGVPFTFRQTGDAQAWNALSGVAGSITDVSVDQGGPSSRPNPQPTHTAFGALTPVGAAPIPVSAADGAYGEFTVLGGQATANTSPLTPGDVLVGTTDLTVVPDAVSVATEAELQAVLSGTTASEAATCYLNPGSYDSDSLDFEGQRGSITYRSADLANRAALNRWRFLATTNLPNGQAPHYREVLFTKPHVGPDDYFFGMFNSDAPDGPMFIYCANACVLDGLSFFDCEIDGQLEPVQNGGRAEIVDAFLRIDNAPGVTNPLIERCAFHRQQTSLKTGLNGLIVRYSTFEDLQGDAWAPRPGSDNTIFEWNYFDASGADNSGLHGDLVQVQHSGESEKVQNIVVRFNISYPKRVMWGQGNPTGPGHLEINTSTVINQADHNGRELRLTGVTGPVVMTLPDPTTVPGQQFCFSFRTGNPAHVSFDLGGATWIGGTPAFTQTNQGLTFVSDGTPVWKRLPRGFSQEWFRRTQDFTLGIAEETWLTYLNAQFNPVTATLPPEAGQTFIINCENADNIARVIPNPGNTITYNGQLVAEVVYWPGLSCTWQGDNAGNWIVTEATGAAQMIFANHAGNSSIENWKIYGNIFVMTSPKGVQFENNGGAKPALNMDIFNNTFLYGIFPDQNSDGQRTAAEGNTGVAVGSIWINGPSIRSWNNVIVGNLNFDGTGGADLNSTALGLSGDKSTIPAALSDRFNINSVDDLFPQTVAELLAIATPKPGGLEDGTFRGATAIGDFVAQTEITATPAPSLTFSVPGNGDTYGTAGTIELTFDQFMMAGAGLITLRNVTGAPAVVESFDPSTGLGDNGGTITVTLTRVVITPGAALVGGQDYTIQAASGALVGHYGDDWAGISDDTTLRFSVDAAVPTSFVSTAVVVGDHWQKAGGLTGAPASTTRMLFGFRGTPELQDPGKGNERLTTFFAEDGASDFGIELFEMDNTIRIIWGSRSYEISGGAKFGHNTEILLSIDTAAASRYDGIVCYVDGVRQVVGGSDWDQNATINPASINTQYALRSSAASRDFAGSVGMLYLDFPATLPNLDSAASRSLFLPYKIGANGNGPSGTQPAFYMTGDLPAWRTGEQLGAGGGGYTRAGNFAL